MSEDAMVRDWMTPNPITVRAGANLGEARAVMERDDIRRVLVVDGDGALVGVVSWGDVMEAWPSPFTMLEPTEVREQMARVMVDEIMSTDVISVDPETSISEVANLMFEYQVGAVPVVDAGRVVGILTHSDILRGLVRILTASHAGPVGGD